MGGQTALNCALDLHRNGVLDKYKVELIGATPEAIDKAEDRAKFKDAMTKIGLGSARSGVAHSMEEAWAVQKRRLPDHHPSIVHHGRQRRRHRLQRRRIRSHLQARPGSFADQRAADRRIAAGLERVRDGSGARQGGQLHHHLLDRKPGPDGRAHRRLDHRGAGTDADRQGIPDHA
jgi:carbamoyl-phosphate synthase large subunit